MNWGKLVPFQYVAIDIVAGDDTDGRERDGSRCGRQETGNSREEGFKNGIKLIELEGR